MVKKEEKKSKEKIKGELGLAGFSIGIESIVFALFIPIIGIVLSINGFIFCAIQQKRNSTKKGKIGIILNIIGFVLGVASWIIATILLNNIQNIFPAG